VPILKCLFVIRTAGREYACAGRCQAGVVSGNLALLHACTRPSFVNPDAWFLLSDRFVEHDGNRKKRLNLSMLRLVLRFAPIPVTSINGKDVWAAAGTLSKPLADAVQVTVLEQARVSFGKVGGLGHLRPRCFW
jgi:hypothetical protein